MVVSTVPALVFSPWLTRSRKPSGQENWSYQMALYMISTQPMSAMAKAIILAVGTWQRERSRI